MLSGTGNAGRQVVLQSNPFPYTQGFANTTNVQLTNPTGAFSFPLLSVPLNTQYRVLIPTKPEIVSPIVTLGVAVKVATSTSATRVQPRAARALLGHDPPGARGRAGLDPEAHRVALGAVAARSRAAPARVLALRQERPRRCAAGATACTSPTSTATSSPAPGGP